MQQISVGQEESLEERGQLSTAFGLISSASILTQIQVCRPERPRTPSRMAPTSVYALQAGLGSTPGYFRADFSLASARCSSILASSAFRTCAGTGSFRFFASLATATLAAARVCLGVFLSAMHLLMMRVAEIQ